MLRKEEQQSIKTAFRQIMRELRHNWGNPDRTNRQDHQNGVYYAKRFCQRVTYCTFDSAERFFTLEHIHVSDRVTCRGEPTILDRANGLGTLYCPRKLP